MSYSRNTSLFRVFRDTMRHELSSFPPPLRLTSELRKGEKFFKQDTRSSEAWSQDQAQESSRRSMDKTLACEAGNAGSIPAEST